MTLAHIDIIDKASKLYRKFGIRSVTMSDLAGELGISKKTLYQYITDKEALIDKVLKADYSGLEETLYGILDKFNDPIRQFIEIQNSIITALSDQSGVIGFELKKYFPEKYDHYFNKYVSLLMDILSKNLMKGIESGIYRENLDPGIVVKTHVVSLLSITDNDLIDLRDHLSVKYSRESLRYHLRAIVSKKHLDTIDKYLETLKSVIT